MSDGGASVQGRRPSARPPPGGGHRVGRPKLPSTAAVLRPWQRAHMLAKLVGSSRRCGAFLIETMWSTSVAGSPHSTHEGCLSRWAARATRQAWSYPRSRGLGRALSLWAFLLAAQGQRCPDGTTRPQGHSLAPARGTDALQQFSRWRRHLSKRTGTSALQVRTDSAARYARATLGTCKCHDAEMVETAKASGCTTLPPMRRRAWNFTMPEPRPV